MKPSWRLLHIVVIIIIVIIIVYIQSIYNYTPVTNYIYTVNSAAAIPCLQFRAHVMFFTMKKRFALLH